VAYLVFYSNDLFLLDLVVDRKGARFPPQQISEEVLTWRPCTGEIMRDTELVELKAALEAKRVELCTELRVHVSDLTIEGTQPEPIDWIQSMADRAEIATLIDRFTSTLANVERSLRDIDEDRYGACMGCGGEIPLKRLQSIPWAAYCVRCQEQFEGAGKMPDCRPPDRAACSHRGVPIRLGR